MASSKDFEKIWESYQEVVKTKDISIVDYCQRNGIVYSQFQRWYKKHVSGVNIEFSNGLKVCQKSISYEHLKMLVEKLEALC